ncbi:MAG: cytochrome c [Bacteroidota bacterium]|nr:cytochrome c [Bacteroidota bacterium]
MRSTAAVFFIVFIMVCSACSDTELASMDQLARGAQLYEKYCANCHQKDGSGLASLMPPLKNSDYLKANKKSLPCIIHKGISGNIIVNNKMFNLAMPANKSLSNQEIANIATYVYQKFLDETHYFTDSLIWVEMKECGK